MPAPKGHLPYNVNGEGGRPIKYTEEYCNKLAANLEIWIDQEKGLDNIFIEDWCLENKVPEEAISTYLNKYERFSQAYNRLKTKQKVYLFKGTLKRKLLHNMSALILSTNHNINLKTEQKISGSSTDPVEFLLSKADGKSKDLVEDEQQSN